MTAPWARSSRFALVRPRRLPARATIGSLLAVVLMVLAAVTIGRAGLHAAEQDRLDERGRLVQSIGKYTVSTFDPQILGAAVARTPFPANSPPVAARLLAQFRTGPSGNPTALAALVRIDGTVVVTNPPGAIVPTTELGATWTNALAGVAGRSGSFSYQGNSSWVTMAPVGIPQWGVVIVVQNSLQTAEQAFIHQLRALNGSDPAGASWVDVEGRALISWSPELLGTRLIPPAAVAAHPQGRIVVSSSRTGDREITTITARAPDGTVTMFRQNTSALFADLRVQQGQRNLTLLGVLTAAVAGLTLASVLRVRTVRRDRARLHALLSSTEDLIMVVGPDSNLTFVGPTVQPLLGFEIQDWLRRPLAEFACPDDTDRLAQLVADPGGVRTMLDLRLRSRDGEYHWFDVEASDVSTDPELRGVLLTCHSVGERKALQDQLLQQARHDPLTGLPNRSVLNRRLSDTLTDTDHRIHPGLLFIDLDRFKQVNDQYGHDAGDQVLRTVAERLLALTRADDLVCRFGGDEFAVVLSSATGKAAQEIANRIVEELGRPITVSVSSGLAASPQVEHPTGTEHPTGSVGSTGTENWTGAVVSSPQVAVRIGASVGIAMAGPGLDLPEALLRAADDAMYRAKELGRGCAVMWSAQVGAEPSPGNALAVAPVMANASPPVPRPAPLDRPEPAATEAPSSAGELTPGVDDRAALAPQPLSTTDLIQLRAIVEARSTRHAWRRRIRSLAALAVVCLAIISVAGLGLWQTREAGRTARQQRLAERLELIARVGEYGSALAHLQRLIGPMSSAPWALDGSVVDSVVLAAVLKSDLGGDHAVGELRRPDGRLLASSGTSLHAWTEGSPTWQSALVGEVGYVPMIERDGELFATYSVPIKSKGGIVAVLIISQQLQSSVAQRMLHVMGSIGFGDGGLSSVSPNGRATYSWNSELIGRQIVAAEELTDLPVSRAVVVKGPPGHVTLAARASTPVAAHRKIIVFQQTDSVFYGDLRAGQRQRDLALFAVVVVAIALLGLAQRQRERLARRSGQRLDALLRSAHDIVVEMSAGRATFISSAVTTLLGHHPTQWINQSLVGLVHREDRRRVSEYLRGSGSGGTLHDIRLLAADGSYRWFDLHANDLQNRAGTVGLVLTCHEVGERKALQDELSFRARHDALTGLANRAAFRRHLESLNHGMNGESPGYTVLFIDLDRFKPINDTFGHDAGDDVLRAVAHRLQRSAAENSGSLVCRLGGDEFAVLLPGNDGPTATRLADDILQRVLQPITIRGASGQAVQIAATIGIAHAVFADDAETVVKRADEAMYQAKAAGRGRYAVFTG